MKIKLPSHGIAQHLDVHLSELTMIYKQYQKKNFKKMKKEEKNEKDNSCWAKSMN